MRMISEFRSRKPGVCGVLFVMALVLCLSLPHSVYAESESWGVLGAVSPGCTSGTLFYDTVRIFPDGPGAGHCFSTIAESGGQVYMDEYFCNTSFTTGSQNWGLFNENIRGLQTAPFPIPAGAPVNVQMQVRDAAEFPVWETNMTINDCAVGTITESTYGPIRQLNRNAGFELGTAAPKNWTLVNAINDARVCNDTVPGISHAGECAFRFKNQPGESSKITQTVKAKVGEAEDVLRVMAWVSANNTAGGTITVKGVYIDGTIVSVVLPIPVGTYAYREISNEAVLTQQLKQVKTTVKGLGGELIVDNVATMVVANAAKVRPFPSAAGLQSQAPAASGSNNE